MGLRLVSLAVAASAVAAVEIALVAPGHVLAAQIADAALVAVLVNVGRGGRTQHSEPDAAAIAAMRALALVPLMRVVALALPMRPEWPSGLALLLVALPLGVAAVRMAPAVGVARSSLFALRRTTSHAFAAGAGIVLGLLAYAAGAPKLWADGISSQDAALALVAITSAAIVEELIFRGVLQMTFQRAAGTSGVLAVSALFAAVYIPVGSMPLVLVYMLAGLVFAASVAHTSALGGAIIGHALLALGAAVAWPLVFDDSRPFELNGVGMTVALVTAIGIAASFAGPAADGPADAGRQA